MPPLDDAAQQSTAIVKRRRDDRPSPIALSNDKTKMLTEALALIDQCGVSQGIRAAYCRQLNAMVETGKQDGTRSLINMLYHHLARTAAHMYSPVDLTVSVECENDYPTEILKRCTRVAKLIGRDWARSNADISYGQGVFESLKYGAALMKQYPKLSNTDGESTIGYEHKLVMPWQFGVLREDEHDLSRQAAFCETFMLTMQEVWNRIWHFPDAEALFERIKKNSNQGSGGDNYNSFFHQVFSTQPLQTGLSGGVQPLPGGIVQLTNDPNYSIMGPDVMTPMVKMYELWVWGPTDYEMVQIIEPDILITRYKRGNGLIAGHDSGLHPYTLIQPNQVHGYFWGRPEIVDLFEPQGLLSQWAHDLTRMFGLQIDKIIGFSGFDGLNDENYDQMRGAGFFNMPPGATATDLTPQMPPNALQMLEFVIKVINMIGGFDNILSGGGEPGVRAGNHAETLMKTASPFLRDRALLVERQLAMALDLRLKLNRAKNGQKYWTDGTNQETIEKTSFLIDDLPEDAVAEVDSHSSAPIFMDNHQNLVAWATSQKILDPELAIELLPFRQKDLILHKLREREARQADMMKKLIERDPEAAEKLLAGTKKKK